MNAFRQQRLWICVCAIRANAIAFCWLCSPGSTPLRSYPLLSVITHQQPQSPHLPLLSPQHPVSSEPAHSETPVSISSESETEHSAPRLKKPRRSRTIFTELQLLGLEKKFQKQKYLSTPDRSVAALRGILHYTFYSYSLRLSKLYWKKGKYIFFYFCKLFWRCQIGILYNGIIYYEWYYITENI